MTVEEIYVRETGDNPPDNQIAYCEWHQRYVRWLEQKVQELTNVKNV